MPAGRDDSRRDHWVAELVRRGMSEVRAELLASSPTVDLHAVRDALDAGCPPATAWRIWNTETPPPRKPRKRKTRSLRESSPRKAA